MQKFIQSLSAYSGKRIQPLSHITRSSSIHNALSFGLFTPLAQRLLSSVSVRSAMILHPFFYDEGVENLCRYEIGTEHGVSVLLGLECEDLSDFIATLDVGYLVNESSLCDEELECIQEFVREGGALLVGRDLYWHAQSGFIAQILGTIIKGRDIEIFAQDLLEPYTAPRDSMLDHTLDGTILETLPESNGAFGYMCLKSEMPESFGCESACANLLAPESFKMILKVAREGVYRAQLCSLDSQKSPIDAEYRLDFCPHIKGTIGCLPSAEVSRYPFVRIATLMS